MPPTESCKWGFGNRYSTLDIKVVIGVYYRKPADKKLKMYSGKTVEAHENAHVENYKQVWAGTEKHINEYGKLCFCSTHCQKLRDDLMSKGRDLWVFWAMAQNALIDYNDYPPEFKASKKALYDTSMAAGNATMAEFDALKKKFDKDCK